MRTLLKREMLNTTNHDFDCEPLNETTSNAPVSLQQTMVGLQGDEGLVYIQDGFAKVYSLRF